jgi:HEAT repeat protein
MAYEQSGRISLPLLLEMADEKDPTAAMYAITALGRNGHPQAVAKLLSLLAARRQANPLLLETIVDALGETRSPQATPALLELLGVGTSWTSRLREKLSRKSEEQRAREEWLREQLTLPVARALEKIADPRAAEASLLFLDHAEPLVRCHAIRTIMNAGFTRGLDRIRHMAEADGNPLVRKLAGIALDRLTRPASALQN